VPFCFVNFTCLPDSAASGPRIDPNTTLYIVSISNPTPLFAAFSFSVPNHSVELLSCQSSRPAQESILSSLPQSHSVKPRLALADLNNCSSTPRKYLSQFEFALSASSAQQYRFKFHTQIMSSTHQSVQTLPLPDNASQGTSPALMPKAQSSIPPCKFIYGKDPTANYTKRYDRVSHSDEITKVVIVGLCMGFWLWRPLGLAVVYGVCLMALAAIATVTKQRYEELRGRWRWMFNKIIKFGCWMNLLFMGIYHVREHNVSKQEFDRIRERYSHITPEEEKAVTYPPFYVISNHSSIADPAVSMYVYGPLSVVAKKGLKSIPVFGTICRLIQCLFVGENNQQIVEQLYQREKSYIEKVSNAPKKKFHRKVPPQMLIFPEGTCTNGKQIIRFHGGAFKNGQAVQPLVIRYPYKNFNMSWVKMGVSFFPFLLGQFYNNCEVYKLPAYIPNEAEKADWRLYAYNVQRVMVDVVNMYLHEDEKMFASDELFFRHPPRSGSEAIQEQVEAEPRATSPTSATTAAAPVESREAAALTPQARPSESATTAATPARTEGNPSDEYVVIMVQSHVDPKQRGSVGSSKSSKRHSLHERASDRLNSLTDDIEDSFSVPTDVPEDFVSVHDDLTPSRYSSKSPFPPVGSSSPRHSSK